MSKSATQFPFSTLLRQWVMVGMFGPLEMMFGSAIPNFPNWSYLLLFGTILQVLCCFLVVAFGEL